MCTHIPTPDQTQANPQDGGGNLEFAGICRARDMFVSPHKGIDTHQFSTLPKCNMRHQPCGAIALPHPQLQHPHLLPPTTPTPLLAPAGGTASRPAGPHTTAANSIIATVATAATGATPSLCVSLVKRCISLCVSLHQYMRFFDMLSVPDKEWRWNRVLGGVD